MELVLVAGKGEVSYQGDRGRRSRFSGGCSGWRDVSVRRGGRWLFVGVHIGRRGRMSCWAI